MLPVQGQEWKLKTDIWDSHSLEVLVGLELSLVRLRKASCPYYKEKGEYRPERIHPPLYTTIARGGISLTEMFSWSDTGHTETNLFEKVFPLLNTTVEA